MSVNDPNHRKIIKVDYKLLNKQLNYLEDIITRSGDPYQYLIGIENLLSEIIRIKPFESGEG